MIERLEVTLEKYQALEQELTKPEVLSDIKKTREYSKEMSSLEDIVNCYKKYKKVLFFDFFIEKNEKTSYYVITTEGV